MLLKTAALESTAGALEQIAETLAVRLANFLQFSSSHLKPVKIEQNMIIGIENPNILVFLPGFADFSPHFLMYGCK